MSRQRIEFAPGCFRDVDDNVVPIVDASRVEAAWQAYAAQGRRLIEDPKLLCDREFNQDMAKLYARWWRLYLQTEHAG